MPTDFSSTESSVIQYLAPLNTTSPGKVSNHFSSGPMLIAPLTFIGTLSQPPKGPPEEMNLEET